MAAGEWFEKWFDSPYYPVLYHQRDEKEADAFVDRLIDHLKLPADGKKLLDIACGRGRHARQLAAKGFDVTGIDLSPRAITSAQQHTADNLHFYLHDMRLPFWVNYFDYAFNFFTSIGYFRTERENYNAIRTIANAVKPGGIVVIDYLNAHYTENHLEHAIEEELEGVKFFITKWFDETHFHKKIEIMDEDLIEPLVYTEQVAKYSLGDMTDMLAFHDLQVQEVYGDYFFGHYDVKKSPRMIVLAKKFLPPI